MKSKTMVILSILLVFCGSVAAQANKKSGYVKIPQSEAKKIMDGGQEYILVDVRTKNEYKQKHIPGALLIPVDEIGSGAEKELKDKDALILVYCRSGARSRRAAKKLAALGYTNVKDIGGINSWKYETQ